MTIGIGHCIIARTHIMALKQKPKGKTKGLLKHRKPLVGLKTGLDNNRKPTSPNLSSETEAPRRQLLQCSDCC